MIFVSPHWLHAHLHAPHIKIIDGSWHMPSSNRNARDEYTKQHIENAVFFDIDEVSDHTSPLPHMMPNMNDFSQAVGKLGISNNNHVIVYDSVGLFSAARVRFMFKSFGHENVSILEGGLPDWLADNLPVTNVPSHILPCNYSVPQNAAHIVCKADVENAIKCHTYQILDARPAPRYMGEIDEPRPNLRRGHIETSKNVPFSTLIQNGKLKQAFDLKNIFDEAGIDITKPAITTCGSGVSACIINLALEVLNAPPALLYDGSWAEWGA